MKKIIILCICVLGLLIVSANADPTSINPGSGEPTLYGPGGILDGLYGWSNLTRIDDSVDQIWYNPDGVARAEAKYASYTQDFGFIDPSNTFNSLIVAGSTPTSWVSIPHLLPYPSGYVFRFADDPSGAQMWTSQQSDNSGQDHMVTWLITGNVGHPNEIGNYVIAWEDVNLNSADKDYNDLVVEVHAVRPIPAPAAVVLGMMGVGLVGWIKRRFA